LIFKKSTLHSSHPGLLDKWFILFLVPMTVLSLALTLGVIFLWTEIFDPQAMAQFAVNFSYDSSIQSLITRVPLWMFLHSLLTVLLTTHLSLNYFTRKAAPPADVFE
jgi:formate-dependent nitrite reductase membrane component NrfD